MLMTIFHAPGGFLAAGDTARQAAFTYVYIPALIICVLAAAAILAGVFVPKLYSRAVSALKGFVGKLGSIRWAGRSPVDRVIEDSGFAYDARQDIFYSQKNAWQRQFGYCRLYDEAAAPMSMIIDCEPFYFDYGGKKWLIELWKGQYGMTMGGEIGVFNTTEPELNIPHVFNGPYYYCASPGEELELAFTLRKETRVLFTRNDVHWWLTGFLLGEFADPSQLTMYAEITLRDQVMRDAFVRAVKAAGYADSEFTVKGTAVSLQYGTPHTPQPVTRTAPTDWIIQRNGSAKNISGLWGSTAVCLKS